MPRFGGTRRQGIRLTASAPTCRVGAIKMTRHNQAHAEYMFKKIEFWQHAFHGESASILDVFCNGWDDGDKQVGPGV